MQHYVVADENGEIISVVSPSDGAPPVAQAHGHNQAYQVYKVDIPSGALPSAKIEDEEKIAAS